MTVAESRSQTDVVLYGIKEMILDGTLHPGARLPTEPELAAQLSVSRSSLREGVRALSAMGVLETRQGSGTYVTSLDPSLLMLPLSFLIDLQRPQAAVDLQAVRRVLETYAAQEAARHITAEELAEAGDWLARMQEAAEAPQTDHLGFIECDAGFHRVIARASRNPVLEALIVALTSETLRARLWRASHEAGAERATVAEHGAIYEALRAGQPEHAALRMANHILGVESFLAPGAPIGDVEQSPQPDA
jgi:DNA-binding FadR family transcriptional regulator